MSERKRAWCFTINNYTESEYPPFDKMGEVTYGVYGKEVGEQNTPHLQCFVYFKNARERRAIVKHCPRAGNVKPMYSDILSASNYCKKDGDFVEYGTLPKQGKRNDLDEVRDAIMQGQTVDELAVTNPNLYHQYGRTLTKIEDLRMRKNFRKEMTEGIWIYGQTGVGKSERLFEGFDPETHYSYPYDGGWCDGYAQQETVIIDEFRGQIPFNELLRMVDKHPNYSMRRRGREPMPFTSKIVKISSSMHPRDVFYNLDENDSFNQLYRRFKIYKIDSNGEMKLCTRL